MWIAKISGVTNLDAAISIDVSNEFAIGVIIDDISDVRHISKFDARRIFANLEYCYKIAEIVPKSLDDIFETFDECNPDMIQVNGKFFDDENQLISLQSLVTVPIIGSLFLNKEDLTSNILDPNPVEAAKKLDMYVSVINLNLPIGYNWKNEQRRDKIIKLINEIRDNINKPLVVGGGLNNSNVGEVIEKLKPHAIDISSGVERLTGIKDPLLMREFLELPSLSLGKNNFIFKMLIIFHLCHLYLEIFKSH